MRDFIKIRLIGMAMAGLVFTGCGLPTEVGEVKPVSFENVDELFAAVNQQLGCPEDSSGDYAFDVGEERDLLTGRRCAESVVMAQADDETLIADIQEMISTAQGGPVPIVHGTTWFVADITEVATGNPDLAQPESRDLEALATAFRAHYTEL